MGPEEAKAHVEEPKPFDYFKYRDGSILSYENATGQMRRVSRPGLSKRERAKIKRQAKKNPPLAVVPGSSRIGAFFA